MGLVNLLRELHAVRAQGRRLDACRCGHERRAHEHHRAGSDCCHCSCTSFDRPSFLRR